MNTNLDPRDARRAAAPLPARKPFEAPALRREAELPVATAGSFDIK